MDVTGSVHPRATARLEEADYFRAPAAFGATRTGTIEVQRVTVRPGYGFTADDFRYTGSGVHVNTDGTAGRRPAVDHDLPTAVVPMAIRRALARELATALYEEYTLASAHRDWLLGQS